MPHILVHLRLAATRTEPQQARCDVTSAGGPGLPPIVSKSERTRAADITTLRAMPPTGPVDAVGSSRSNSRAPAHSQRVTVDMALLRASQSRPAGQRVLGREIRLARGSRHG
jgi:hypothetical protein